MNDDDRPNPDELLRILQQQESRKYKGKLKIFLGMAAGVGKTYAMLESAQKQKKAGVDVVVGVVATHGREDTAKLLENLEVVPPKQINYKEVVFNELDLDALIARKPKVAVIDELAHSNVPGSRHPKRWQDIVEILDHGIDVYTTLNVQHIESLKDVVEKIVGIAIRETVPDLIIETAAFIELIDLTPEELMQRLKEGKVYLGDQSAIAARNFFQEDRLTALREIVLRYAAEKVDHDLQSMFTSAERVDAWKPRERLLVAISHSPHSQKLIRITRRLAFNLDAPWIAVHVDDGKVLHDEDKEVLAKNLALARDLGAEVITTTAPEIAPAIQRIARQKSISQIIIGRPPRRWMLDFFQRNTLMDHLARECSDIDLHVIRQTMLPGDAKRRWRKPLFTAGISSYVSMFFLVLLLAMFNWLFLPFVGYKISGFIFLLYILGCSLFYRKGPIFFASILYGLIWAFFFIPFGENKPFSNEDLVLLTFYLLTAIFTGVLIDREKRHQEMLVKRERSTEALYEVVHEIASSPSFDEALQAVKEKLSSVLDGRCDIALKQIDNTLAFSENSTLFFNDKEKAAATWVFQNGKEAGWSTSTLPSCQSLYVPLKGLHEVVGVLAYSPKTGKGLSIEEKNFIYTVGQQLANYMERSLSEERARQIEHHKQVEKTHQSILNLIENLFEGPLLTIQDSVKEINKGTIEEFPLTLNSPVDRILNASHSLTHILDNISAMVNLSAGLTPVKRLKQDIKKLIESCYERIKKGAENYEWRLTVEDHLPEILCDRDLIELLFYNIVFHSMEFSIPGTVIEIDSRRNGDFLQLTVAGEGQSIPPDMIDVAFENIYRISSAGVSSSFGLGLAIAKTIAEVHGGQIKVQNNPKGGMIFAIVLPVAI